MLHCIGRIATIIALCCAIGLHWLALQSVAWTAMLIEHSKRVSLCQAMAQTFDGVHPCSLCHAVNKGKNSEKKSDLQSPTPKMDLICVTRVTRLSPLFAPFDYGTCTFSSPEITHSPPVPPPRFQLS